MPAEDDDASVAQRLRQAIDALAEAPAEGEAKRAAGERLVAAGDLAVERLRSRALTHTERRLLLDLIEEAITTVARSGGG